MSNKAKLSLLLPFILFSQFLNAQQNQLEIWSGSATIVSTVATNTPKTVTLFKNTGITNTFSAYTPLMTATLSFANVQNFTAPNGNYPVLQLGGTSGGAGNDVRTMPGTNNTFFQSSPSTTSTPYPNISVDGASPIPTQPNYGWYIGCDGTWKNGSSSYGRYYEGDLVITFNRPVINPVIHVTHLGAAGNGYISGTSGTTTPINFYAELELTAPNVSSGYTLTKLAGNTYAVLDATNTKILNSTNTFTAASAFDPNIGTASAGSFRVNTNNVAVSKCFFSYVYKVCGGQRHCSK